MKKITFKIGSLVLLGLAFSNLNAQTKIYIDEKFQATDISGGSVLLTDKTFTQYNYTADIKNSVENWLNTTTPPTAADKTNAVSVHGGSVATQYAAANVGGQQALRVAGATNYTSASAGIYFTGLDLTGQTTLYFKFQVWGGNKADDADIETTLKAWNINLNYGNSSTNLTLSDTYFAAGPNVIQNIPLSITVGSTTTTGVTSFDIPPGEWATVSGSVDLTGKTVGNFAALQIQTDTGDFVSGGKVAYAIDNVYVSNAAPTLSNNDFEEIGLLSIYPNPVKEQLFIQNQEGITISDVRLLDATGRQVYQSNTNESIDVRKMTKGIYFLKLKTTQGKVTTKKIVID